MKKITITERILKRPVTVFMMSLIVIGFGLFSLNNLKVTLMPEFNIPVLAVSLNYENVAPDDVSRLLVEPVEGAIMGVEGINSLESNVAGRCVYCFADGSAVKYSAGGDENPGGD